MSEMEPLDGFSFSDGGDMAICMTEIYSWIRERLERASGTSAKRPHKSAGEVFEEMVASLIRMDQPGSISGHA